MMFNWVCLKSLLEFHRVTMALTGFAGHRSFFFFTEFYWFLFSLNSFVGCRRSIFSRKKKEEGDEVLLIFPAFLRFSNVPKKKIKIKTGPSRELWRIENGRMMNVRKSCGGPKKRINVIQLSTSFQGPRRCASTFCAPSRNEDVNPIEGNPIKL